jgi:hypothetical protein
MDATFGLAAILRDGRVAASSKDEVRDSSSDNNEALCGFTHFDAMQHVEQTRHECMW